MASITQPDIYQQKISLLPGTVRTVGKEVVLFETLCNDECVFCCVPPFAKFSVTVKIRKQGTKHKRYCRIHTLQCLYLFSRLMQHIQNFHLMQFKRKELDKNKEKGYLCTKDNRIMKTERPIFPYHSVWKDAG